MVCGNLGGVDLREKSHVSEIKEADDGLDMLLFRLPNLCQAAVCMEEAKIYMTHQGKQRLLVAGGNWPTGFGYQDLSWPPKS
jgi:hypothetical protein